MDRDTSLGGLGKAFPPTTETFLARFRDSEPAVRKLGADTLCQRYWKPVYHYLRTVLARGNEDAKDLTQSFFAWLLERDLLARYDPAQGTFRSYFKAVLRNFWGNRDQELRALKRGGGLKILPLETEADGLPDPAAAPGADPDAVFDLVWMDEMVKRAVERVRQRCVDGLAARQFAAFEAHDLVDAPPTYAEVAGRLGVKETDVHNYLFTIRGQVRREVWEELSEASGNPGQAKEEWDAFFKS